MATALHGAATAVGVTPAPGIDDELAALIATIRAPGPFLAYTHGDPCPGNDLRVGARLRLLDMEVAYRNQLAQGCPVAQDDALFAQAIVTGCAYWALTMYDWNPVADLLAEDRDWGLATSRQRVLVRSEICAQLAAHYGYLEAIGATLAAIVAALRGRWPAEVEALPYFPAFRG